VIKSECLQYILLAHDPSALISITAHRHSYSHHRQQSQDQPHFYFCRHAEDVATDLIGCLLVKRIGGGSRGRQKDRPL